MVRVGNRELLQDFLTVSGEDDFIYCPTSFASKDDLCDLKHKVIDFENQKYV